MHSRLTLSHFISDVINPKECDFLVLEYMASTPFF